MKSKGSSQDDELACLFTEIQEYIRTCKLSGETAGIIYLFFVENLSISEIFKTHNLPQRSIDVVISNFLNGLIVKCSSLHTFLSRLTPSDELAAELYACVSQDNKTAVGDKMQSLIATCDTLDSLGYRIRELVGSVIKINAPLAPSTFCDDMFSKVLAATKLREGHLVKVAPRVEDLNFSLCFIENKAAGSVVEQAAETCSSWTIIVERGAEKIEVTFDIALEEMIDTEEETAVKYAITFHNLPSWATPVSFSFVGPDYWDNIKESKFRSEFCEGQLYFWVENQEQQDLFVDRTKTYIGFIISDPYK